jgi:tripartite-type tricarboxylate transporter receptor subunit TctC
MKKLVHGLSTLAAAVVLATAAMAQPAYPDRPVTWIVPFTAGGPTDAMARNIAQRVGEKLGQTVLIENLPGAGGTIGAARAAQAEPDGYTFLVGHVGYMAAAPAMYADLSYDPKTDFAAVFRFPDTPLVLMVNKDSPYGSLADVLAAAKEKPGELLFGNAGVGSTSHLVAAMFAAEAGIEITEVPYPGAGPALTDLVGGRLDAMFDQTNTALPQVEGGAVKALGITSHDPSAKFPGVEPIGRSGLEGFEVATWYGLYAPAGTPETAIRTMYDAYVEVMQDKGFTDMMVDQGIVLLPADDYSPEAFRRHTDAEVDRWGAFIKEAGITLQ